MFRRKLATALSFILAVSGVSPLLAQKESPDPVIIGRVVESEGGDPVAGVRVHLERSGLSWITSSDGRFRFVVPSTGFEYLSLSGSDILDQRIEVTISDYGVTDIGDLRVKVTKMEADQSLIGIVDALEVGETGSDQTISPTVVLSNDLFLKTAGFRFSQFRYRNRGYDSRYEQRYINGVAFNDLVRGVFNYSSIGAINDLTRNGNVINYVGPSDFSFGDLGGSQNINMRPSSYSRGGKLTLTGTNRNYYARTMVSYNTGLMDSGWAFTALLGGRYAHEGVVEGTFYKNLSYALGAEYQWDEGRQALSLITFGSPVRRGQQGASVDEAVRLAGCYSYNPNWGWQNGKKRNSRIVTSYDPTAILTYDWKPDMLTSWTTALGVHYSHYQKSSLDWFNGADPRPDYYRYLPSYFTGAPDVQDYYRYLWQSGRISQINWDQLYQINELNNRTGDGSAIYMVQGRNNDLFEATINSTLSKQITSTLKVTGGVGYRFGRARQYQTVEDLMGAQYARDVDKFAERDFPGDHDRIQNDLNRADRRVYEGDVFGYDYGYDLHSAEAWVQNSHTWAHLDLYYGGRISYTNMVREGYMRNGRYPDSSYGRGRSYGFVTGDAKVGFTYKFSGHHFLLGNAVYQSRPPLVWDMYVNPNVTEITVDDVKPVCDASVDLSYVFSTPRVTGRLGLFYTKFWDDMRKIAYYNDVERTFVYHTLYDMEKVHRGIEAGISVKATDALSLDLVGTVSQYFYANDPMGVMNSTNGKIENREERVYMKNLYIGGRPQMVGTLGINYFVNYWFLNFNVNGFGYNHIDPAPIRRLASNYTGVRPEGIPGHNPEEFAAFKSITTQERFKGGCTLDLSIGKIIYLPGRHRINLNFSIQNLTDRRDIITGGYEQGRINLKYPERFGNKHYYMQGINLFFNAGYIF